MSRPFRAAPPQPASGSDVRFFGIDLAWGQRARTGLAVLDHSGRLLESASVRTNDEIVGFIGRHPSFTVVGAVDAPLIVPNESGRRQCEALVGQHFSRFGAGAYPANRGNAAFTPRPRGAVLAARLGWDMDPLVRAAPRRRVCIEVYPHPAMVSLFPLNYVIPYKGKSGRDVPALKEAYQRLLQHLEVTCGETLGLLDNPRWLELCASATDATRKFQLEAIEDEIDAIFCAYLAWLWATAPDQMVVLGDYAAGYIVTPHPPPPDFQPGRPASRKASPVPSRKVRASDEVALAFRAAVPRLTVEESEVLAAVAADLAND